MRDIYGARLLIVDDEPALLAMLEKLLRQEVKHFVCDSGRRKHLIVA